MSASIALPREGRLGSAPALLAGGPSRPLLRVKPPNALKRTSTNLTAAIRPLADVGRDEPGRLCIARTGPQSS
jgi:hypothetical protein